MNCFSFLSLKTYKILYDSGKTVLSPSFPSKEQHKIRYIKRMNEILENITASLVIGEHVKAHLLN